MTGDPVGGPDNLEGLPRAAHGPIPVTGNHDQLPPVVGLNADAGGHWVVVVPSQRSDRPHPEYQWRCECGASGPWTTHQTLAEAQGGGHQQTAVPQEDTMPDDPSRPQFVRIGSDDEQRILAYSEDAAIRIGMQLRDALQQAIDVATIEDHLVSISLADWFNLVTAAARADGYLTMGRS